MKQPVPSRSRVQPDGLHVQDALFKYCDAQKRFAVTQAIEDVDRFRLERLLRTESPDSETAANAANLKILWESTEKQLLTECRLRLKSLANDLRYRLENSVLYAQGFLASAKPSAPRVLLPGSRAADFELDVYKSIIVHERRRYLGVLISTTPLTNLTADEVETESCTTSEPPHQLPLDTHSRGELSVEAIRSMSDDEVMLLLEDYARRVVEDPDSRLTMPVKVSVMRIIRRKMLHRFDEGETRPTLGAEAHALAEWIKTKVPSHQAPAASSIEKQLSKHYRRPKPTSNAEIR